MRTYARQAVLGGWAAMLVLTGCESTGQRDGGSLLWAGPGAGFSGRQIDTAGVGDIRPVAERVFRSYFQMDPDASTSTSWVAVPTDVTEQEQSIATPADDSTLTEPGGAARPRQTIGDVVGISPRRYRRLAELRLVPGEGGWTARVRVQLQRLTTTERAAFARERGDDRPTDTAIDRLGPVTSSARDEWGDVRRDRALEQEILDAIQAGLPTSRPSNE